jgi:hypothetical protein
MSWAARLVRCAVEHARMTIPRKPPPRNVGRLLILRAERGEGMSGQLAHQVPRGHGGRLQPLPAPHWTVWDPVRWLGRENDRIDEVVVGPSGVHVILHRGGQFGGIAGGVEAVAAAASVAALLPARYHHALRPAVCLCPTEDVAEVVDGVRLLSPSPLSHAIRHQPRVLSTSEVSGISGRLRIGLVPYPAETPASNRRLNGVWVRVAAATATMAAAAALVFEVGPGRLW